MNRETIEAAIAGAASKTTYVGAGAAGIGAWAASNILSLLGVVIAILGYITNWYFRREQDRREKAKDDREKAEHEARMRSYQLNFDPLPKGKSVGDET
jgi:membrane protein implicated in regulation of membrane protease activity